MLKRLFAVLIEVWSISMVLFMIEVLPNLLHLVLFEEITQIVSDNQGLSSRQIFSDKSSTEECRLSISY